MVTTPPKPIEDVTLEDFNERIHGTHPYAKRVDKAEPCECDDQKSSGMSADFDKYDCMVCDNCLGAFWRMSRSNHY